MLPSPNGGVKQAQRRSNLGRNGVLLGRASIPNETIIVAATSLAAAMLGQDERLGSVLVGKAADLILLEGDPLQDMSSLKQLSWVIKDGVAKRPDEWLRD